MPLVWGLAGYLPASFSMGDLGSSCAWVWAGWEFRNWLEESMGEHTPVTVIRPVLGFPGLLVNRRWDLLTTVLWTFRAEKFVGVRQWEWNWEASFELLLNSCAHRRCCGESTFSSLLRYRQCTGTNILHCNGISVCDNVAFVLQHRSVAGVCVPSFSEIESKRNVNYSKHFISKKLFW